MKTTSEIKENISLSTARNSLKPLHSKSFAGLAIGLTALGISLLPLPANAINSINLTTVNINPALDFSNPPDGSGPFVDTVKMTWTVDDALLAGVPPGEIEEADLINLTFDFLSGGSTIFTDNAIINSVVQNLGAPPNQLPKNRTISDIRFRYGFNPIVGQVEVIQWNNDTTGDNPQYQFPIYRTYRNSASDTMYVLQYPGGGVASITGSTTSWSQDTTAIPFEFNPSMGLILLGVGFGIQQAYKGWRKSKFKPEN